MDETYVVIGIQHIHSKKDGKEVDYTKFSCLKDFDDYAKKSGAVGQDVEVLFLVGNISDIKVNDCVEPVYGKNFNGQAFVKKLNKIG